MSTLDKMPNIGKSIKSKLESIDVMDAEDLIKLGSKEAFFRIKINDSDACFNMLCALEGAIQGIRWHNLSEEDKNELKDYYTRI
jgi:DNA transformation protein